MSKKRTREAPSVDVSLVEVYEDLAHEDEEVRLKAAHRLLTEHLSGGDPDRVKDVLKRLFRGLCSGRKAARLGFSVALTESLNRIKDLPDSIEASEVIDILESVSIPESNTSGQDERDHYFGRLFGCEAIIESGLLLDPALVLQWQRLLDVVCAISNKKPWLRQECGWILCKCVSGLANDKSKADHVLHVVRKLVEHKLIRTPEGLAIWIVVQRSGLGDRLPKNTWKHDDPLASKDMHTLSQVLRDAKASAGPDADFDVQGSATWSGQLHFVWDIVISELLQSSAQHKRVTFGQFWQTAVDDGLFAPSGSRERKHWGLLLFQRMIASAPVAFLPACFTKNANSCLMSSLKATDRYLRKDAQKLLKAVESRSKQEPAVSGELVRALLKIAGMMDFDSVTKTKTLETIFSSSNDQSSNEIAKTLKDLTEEVKAESGTQVKSHLRNLINVQSKLLSQTINKAAQKGDAIDTRYIHTIIGLWMMLVHGDHPSDPPSSEKSDPIKALLHQKLESAFEQMLKLQEQGRHLLLDCVVDLRAWKLAADEEIMDILATGWKKFDIHRRQVLSGKSSSSTEGIALLYGLVIFQIYNNDTDAVSILEELIAFDENSLAQLAAGSTSMENADGLVEIVLSFSSRPSKFLRRITLDIFGAFTSQITRDGLASLIDILQAKESKAGQEELFEAKELDDENDNEDDDSDVEMLDSDVEVVDANNDGEESSVTSLSDTESDSSSGSDDSHKSSTRSRSNSSSSEVSLDGQDDADLIALETSLAQALGTRKLTNEDLEGSSSESETESDMDDDAMLTLDDKLSEVFRTRAAAQSQAKSKQKENKAARENVTNFKNRVLDMIEIYFKNEYQDSNVFSCLLPLLKMVRTTTVKQLAEKGTGLIRTLSNLCKGLQSAPVLAFSPASISTSTKRGHLLNGEEALTVNNTNWAYSLLGQVHEEVCLPSSNAHKGACSQSSILLSKALIKAGAHIETAIQIYSATQVRMLTDEAVTVQVAFFTDWIGFCHSIRGKLGALQKKREPSLSMKQQSEIPNGVRNGDQKSAKKSTSSTINGIGKSNNVTNNEVSIDADNDKKDKAERKKSKKNKKKERKT